MVPRVGVEPTWALSPLDFESSAYTNFATPAGELKIILFLRAQVKTGIFKYPGTVISLGRIGRGPADDR